MNFADDLRRLDQRTRRLDGAVFGLGLAGWAALFIALALWPGEFGGAAKFNTIQILDAVTDYFSALGVRLQRAQVDMFAGQRLENVFPAMLLAKMFAAVGLVAGLLRREFRKASAFVAILVLVQVGGGALRSKAESRIADPREGFHLGPAPGGAVQPVGQPRIVVSDRDRAYWSSRGVQIARIRADLGSDLSTLPAEKRAQMHYVGAQIAYLEHDPVRTAAQLNAIKPAAFNPDADWRIREMQEYAQANGQHLAPGAYQPQTGLTFSLVQRLSTLSWWCALVLLAIGLLGNVARWLTQRRLGRIRKLMEELRPMRSASPA